MGRKRIQQPAHAERDGNRFAFYDLPLSIPSRRQLAAIDRSVRQHQNAATSRCVLLNDFILKHAFDIDMGCYMPVGHRVDIPGKLPLVSETLTGTRMGFPVQPSKNQFFGNALVTPPLYGTAKFDTNNVPPPKFRATNIGFIVVTLEMDCTTPGQLDEILSWTRGTSSGDFATAPFAAVDAELRRLKEYIGYSIVFSGSRSLHFHFVFSTEHLKNAPVHANVEARSAADQKAESALLHRVHNTYWDHVREVFVRILNPSIPPDEQMRSLTKWRRIPWGIRILTEDSPVLSLREGTAIPQLVIHENLRRRAGRGTNEFHVPAMYSLAHPVERHRLPSAPTSDDADVADEAIQVLQEICRTEWGEYPKPVQVGMQSSEWRINFRNHSGDRKPSSLALGDHRKLLLAGNHSFGQRDFFLPDHMTANELVQHAMLMRGRDVRTPAESEPNETTRVKPERTESRQHPLIPEMEARFAIPLSTEPKSGSKAEYRAKLSAAIGKLRTLSHGYVNDPGDGTGPKWMPPRHVLLKSVEGIGKTRAHEVMISNEILDDAVAASEHGKSQRFGAFAFRSHEQAEQKASEYQQTMGNAVVIKSLWSHYEEACMAVGEKARRGDLENSPNGILAEMRALQPAVLDEMERRRKALWTKTGAFNAGTTMLFMSHAMAMRWHHSEATLIWHHPAFDPDLHFSEQRPLRDQFRLSKVVFDEPELDDVLHRIPGALYDCLATEQAKHPGWSNRARSERYEVYEEVHASGRLSDMDFERFDELMRLNLSKLESVRVDYDRIPFGFDQSDSGIYRAKQEERYYLGPQSWMFDSHCQWIFLTTEDLITEAIDAVYSKSGQSRLLIRCDLDAVSGVFPIKGSLFIDGRAKSGTLGALVEEIVAAQPTARIIADKVKSPRVTNFTVMKGSNEFEHDDIIIIPQLLHPDHYALLNVTGVFLGRDDVIDLHYRDLITQAVGRNRGFRESSARDTTTRIVASNRLLKLVLSKMTGTSRVATPPAPDAKRKPWNPPPLPFGGGSRVQLYRINRPPWSSG